MRQNLPVVLFNLVAVLLLGLASWGAQQQIRSNAQLEVGESLSAVLDTSHQALESWLEEHESGVMIWANTPAVRAIAKSLLALPRNQTSLVNSPEQANLRNWLRPVTHGKGYLGYFIIGPDNINLASGRDQNIGSKNLFVNQQTFLQRAWSGATAVSLPVKSTVPLPDAHGKLRDGMPTMFVGAPIKGENGEVLAIFTFRIDPSDDFARILQQGRIGRSGETYAFDRQGLMISNSRFIEQLRHINLIDNDEQAILNVQIRDPGVNLVETQTAAPPLAQRPLTLMAGKAVTGQSGMDLNGYRDYRGVSVVGAWRWDETLGFGLATELDRYEAYQLPRATRYAIASLSLLLILFSIGLTVILINNRARRRAQLALEESEARLDNFFQASFEGIFLHEEGKILDVNPATTKVFGYLPSETIGKNLLEFVAAESRDLVQARMASAHEGPYEVTIVAKDGSKIPVEVCAKTISIAGKHVRVAGLHDISERKHAEKIGRRSEVLELLATGASLPEILNALVSNAEKHNPEMICSVLVLDEQGKHLLHGAAPSLPDFYNDAINGIEIGPTVGSCGATAYSGERVIVEDVMAHPYWEAFRDLAAQAGLRACWAEPIFSCSGDILGSFAIYYLEPRTPLQQDLKFIQDSAQLAGVAIEHKQSEAKLHQLLQQNRSLTQSLFEVQEAERRHLSRELHDEFGQWLTAVQLHAQSITNSVEDKTSKIYSSAKSICESATKMHQVTRGIIHQLRPQALDELGLTDGLRELIAQWKTIHPETECKLVIDGEFVDLDETLTITVYRVVQESLTNVVRYSKANHVTIHLSRPIPARIFLSIEDDGKGIDLSIPREGTGLAGIRERVLAVGGEVALNSEPGQGVAIEVKLKVLPGGEMEQ